jgi:hypothetical protein
MNHSPVLVFKAPGYIVRATAPFRPLPACPSAATHALTFRLFRAQNLSQHRSRRTLITGLKIAQLILTIVCWLSAHKSFGPM